MKKLYLLGAFCLLAYSTFAQLATETFTNLPATPINSYFSVNWTGDNGLPWTASDSRIDQVVNAGNKAIGLRNGTLSCANIPNGVDSIAFTYKYLFTSGGTANLTVKVNGIPVGTLAVPQTQTTPAVATFSNFSVSGNFLLEIVEGTSGPRVGIDDITWRSVVSIPCVPPTAEPGAISFNSVTTTSMNVAFAAAATPPNQYIAVMSNSPLVGAPVNGTDYAVDDPIGNGTVEYIGSNLSFNNTNLTPGTLYYFTIFSVNNYCTGGPLYKTDVVSSGSQATTTPPICATPTGQVSDVNFSTISNSSLGGSFTAAPDADSYLVCYTLASTVLGFAPVSGTSYTAGQAVGNGFVTKVGVGTTFSQNGLTANTAYNFYFFSYNGAGCTGGPLYNTTPISALASTNNNSTGIPVGYYDAILSGDTCSLIKTKLKVRTTTGMRPRAYGELPAQYYISDKKVSELRAGSPDVLWDIYSDKPSGTDAYDYLLQPDDCTGNNEGGGWNREHSVPQNWFTGGTATGPGSDYYHIYPTDCVVNGWRSSWIYSEVAAPTTTSTNGSKVGPSAFAGLTGTAFEPINEYKGDLARSFLYFVTRYQDQMPGWTGGTNGTQAMDPTTFPSVDLPYLTLMLKWHHQDPVSQKEIDRNNAGFVYQGNRNPYIDHPEYVDQVWSPIYCAQLTALPVDMTSFIGYLKGDNIKLEWEVRNEQKLLQYEIERSVNEKDYTKVGTVKAINASRYNFSDDVNQLSGRRLFYRIKKVDQDGKGRYSSVVTVNVPLNLQFFVYPNPVSHQQATISFTKPTTTGAVLLVSDMTGKLHQKTTVPKGTTTMSVNFTNVPAGMYVVKLVQQGNTVIQKIQVQ